MTPEQWSAHLESLRREPISLAVSSKALVLGPTKAILDYSSAGLKVDAAKSHMDESIPNRQKLRTQEAFWAAQEGMQELAVWLRANGYDV